MHGLVKARITALRVQMLATAIHIQTTDQRGKTWDIHGAAVAGHSWYSFNPCHVSYQSTMRYRCDEMTGYGEVGDIFALDYLAAKMSRAGRKSGTA